MSHIDQELIDIHDSSDEMERHVRSYMEVFLKKVEMLRADIDGRARGSEEENDLSYVGSPEYYEDILFDELAFTYGTLTGDASRFLAAVRDRVRHIGECIKAREEELARERRIERGGQ